MTVTPAFLLETPRARTAYDGPTMAHDLIANLEALLAKGGDGATLRLALASRYLDAGDAPAAVRHAEAAVRLDPEYSAAWKALGRALTAANRNVDALTAYERGADVAERRGDRQAANEIRVFAKRLRRAQDESR
jgi:predicted Zn-dependent protease